MVLLKAYRRAPAVLAGALSAFLITISMSCEAALPEELFSEEMFEQCRAECLRVLLDSPDNNATRLTYLKAGRRLGLDQTSELASLADGTNVNQEIRCEANFELASIHSQAGEHKEALSRLIYCFNHTASSTLFASATQEANTILNSNTALEKAHPELVNVIRTASGTWPRGRRTKAASPPLLARPALWVISFYRSQISPAIGARCSLIPSCSQYAVEALMKHPLAGIGITGDRMIREPDVAAAKDTPVVVGREIKYADPVSAHDFWMEKNK